MVEKKSYNEKDYSKFVALRDRCSKFGFDNYDRNIARLDTTEFLRGFDDKTQAKMFKRDDKEHSG